MGTETLPYGTDSSLQTVTVTTFAQPSNTGYWLVLIHGGAWRDPTQTSTNYLAPISNLLSPKIRNNTAPLPIAGIASISYRLSEHPDHPQDPKSTLIHDLRTAKHPDHIKDVQAALAFLQARYGFGDRYVLVGHSCGAILAFQSVMGRFRSANDVSVPRAILGMAGIYNIRLIRDMHPGVAAYQEIIEGAFGADENGWDAASPAVVDGEEGVEGGWGVSGRLAVLAHSSEDGLVDLEQRDAMRTALRRWEAVSPGRAVELLDLTGQHDEAWEKGDELARGIIFVLEKLRVMESA
ncbi:Alpha/Beta hydrolase protein [Aspergillus ambiguus]|uniref:arylformamidase n=1 Tax=Aspergillus ambiguus TaxID=176160 RepID=UPI003CCE2F64